MGIGHILTLAASLGLATSGIGERGYRRSGGNPKNIARDERERRKAKKKTAKASKRKNRGNK